MTLSAHSTHPPHHQRCPFAIQHEPQQRALSNKKSFKYIKYDYPHRCICTNLLATYTLFFTPCASATRYASWSGHAIVILVERTERSLMHNKKLLTHHSHPLYIGSKHHHIVSSFKRMPSANVDPAANTHTECAVRLHVYNVHRRLHNVY